MKKSHYISIPLIYLFWALLFEISVSHGKIYIDVDSPQFLQIPIGVEFFNNQERGESTGDISREIIQVMTQDLEISGFFRLVDTPPFSDSHEDYGTTGYDKINFKDWSLMGAEALVKGSYSIDNNTLVIKAKLYDVFQGKFVMGKEYTGKREDLRRMVHRFCDEILLSFTGERGVFDSRLHFSQTSQVIKRFTLLTLTDIIR